MPSFGSLLVKSSDFLSLLLLLTDKSRPLDPRGTSQPTPSLFPGFPPSPAPCDRCSGIRSRCLSEHPSTVTGGRFLKTSRHFPTQSVFVDATVQCSPTRPSPAALCHLSRFVLCFSRFGLSVVRPHNLRHFVHLLFPVPESFLLPRSAWLFLTQTGSRFKCNGFLSCGPCPSSFPLHTASCRSTSTFIMS